MVEIVETKDTERLLEMRMEVLDCVFGHPDRAVMQELAEANRRYYEERLADGSHVAFLAYDDGELCGSGALCLYDEMPSPDNLMGRCAYIMNVYVRPEFRCRGIAAELVDRLVRRAKSVGAGKIYLESTEMARDLYQAAGFRPMPGMMRLQP